MSVSSQFKDMYLGPTTNVNTVTGLMNAQLTMFFELINSALDPMLASWTYLNTTQGQTAISNLLTAQVANIRNITSVIDANIESMSLQFGVIPRCIQLSDQMGKLEIALGALYGLILSLSILLLVCAIALACWSVVRLRHIIYVVCGALIVLGVASFTALVMASLLIPVGSQACTYLDKQLSSPSAAQQFFVNVGLPKFGEMVAPCFGGDSNMVKQVSQPLSDALDNIVTISSNTQTFPTLTGRYTTSNVQSVFSNARNIIISVYNASKLDLNDTVSSNFFTSLATKAYPVLGTCNTTTVGGDCWVPSFTAGTCSSGIGRMGPCSNLSNLTVCPLGCYEIQNTFANPSGDSGYATHLSARYNSGCSYINLIVNVHNNYNQVKMTTLVGQNGSVNSI